MYFKFEKYYKHNNCLILNELIFLRIIFKKSPIIFYCKDIYISKMNKEKEI